MMVAIARRRPIPLLLAGPVALAALCLTLLLAISDTLETDEPQAALHINPFNAQARLQSILDVGLQDKDPAAARLEIQTHLATSVGDARNYSLMGTTIRNLGDAAKAKELFAFALRLNPSEPNAARMTVEMAVADGRFADALQGIEAYARKGGPGAQDISGQLVRIALADPRALAAILQSLSNDPPWRGSFLVELQKSTAGLSIIPRAIAALRGGQRKATEVEIASAVRAYLSAGNVAGAYRIFVSSRDAASRPLVSFVYNSEFKAAPSGNPFDWSIARSGAAEIRIPGAKGEGAEISFLERPAAGFGLSQTLALLPGSYTGAIEAKAVSLIAPDAVYAYVRCASGRMLAKTDMPTGTYQARTIAFKVEVPESGCETQTLGFATNQLFQHWSRTFGGELTVRSVRLNAVSE